MGESTPFALAIKPRNEPRRRRPDREENQKTSPKVLNKSRDPFPSNSVSRQWQCSRLCPDSLRSPRKIPVGWETSPLLTSRGRPCRQACLKGRAEGPGYSAVRRSELCPGPTLAGRSAGQDPKARDRETVSQMTMAAFHAGKDGTPCPVKTLRPSLCL